MTPLRQSSHLTQRKDADTHIHTEPLSASQGFLTSSEHLMSMVGYTHTMQPSIWGVETLDRTGFFNICYSNI